MATSKVVKRFLGADGITPLEGASVYLVPQADSYPTNAIAMTEDLDRPGMYTADNVADGEYKIYIDPTGFDGVALYETEQYIGEKRLSLVANNFDATDSYKMFGTALKDDAVTADKVNADVAGNGLTQAVSGALQVNVDGSTLEIASDVVQVKDGGIVAAKLGTGAVTAAKITDGSVTSSKVADGGIGATQLAANAVTTSKITDGSVTPVKLGTQTVTVVSTTNPTPAYVGQIGRDASGNTYTAISLTGTMWARVESTFLQGLSSSNVVTKDGSGYIDNALLNNTVYEHGTAAAYNGNSTYYFSGRGLGFYMTYGVAKTFSVIKFKGWAAADSVVRVRVYRNTGLWNRDNIDAMTLVKEFNYTAGQFNTTADSFATLVLDSPITLGASEYLYVLFASSAGTSVSLRFFDSVAYSGLFQFLKKTVQANAWLANDSWNVSSATTEIGVPFKLYLGFAYLGDVNALSDATTTALAGKADVNASTGLISGAYVEPYTYLHPNGPSEFWGNDEYSSSGKSQGFQLRVTAPTIVKGLRAPIRGAGDSVVVAKVYRSTTALAGNTVSGLTLVKTFNFPAGTFNTETYRMQEFILDSPIKLATNEYIYLLVQKTAGSDVIIRYWTSAGSPTRDRFLTNTSDPWGAGTWPATSSQYYTCPLLLLGPAAAVAEVSAKQDIQNPFLHVPAKIAVVVGYQLNLWYDALIWPNPYFRVKVTNNGKGTVKERCWRYNPAATETFTITLDVVDRNGRVYASKIVTIQAVAANAGAGTKRVLIAGDSHVDNETMTNEVYNILNTGGGFTPAFLGPRGDAPAYNVGYGGWQFASFSGFGRTGYNFTGLAAHTIAINDIYTNNGSTFTVSEVYSTRIVCERTSGSNLPSASGNLVKVSGSGGATIAYTAYAVVSLNPFWDDSGAMLSVQAWLTEQGYANGPDFFVMHCGINDTKYQYYLTDAQISAIVTNATTIAASVLGEFPSCKVGFCLPAICANSQDSLTSDRTTYETNIRKLYAAMITAFDGGAYNANVGLIPTGLFVDRQYGYGTTTEAVSSRVATTVTVTNDGLHPNSAGYGQAADAIAGWIKLQVS